ncbi:unknown [Haloarcula marismortui ATCC 43049]|uniref:Uncharacterized protein n=1 Tax=Haloarcula marismortui (strain ATCC 43049 / DSM 3752 / JCM 8966 / VKM B-1809) TaxID=272569 RepID=Q5V4D2_HALMA|nr:hypothetical protein [Haloarcula marismortui]AAV45620.1 unknown [Haloarcula marismortui ATCC 43049]QCP90404.1 hypothetical protein E6P14_05855 [Haloarcula marismortui ATCC 43049]
MVETEQVDPAEQESDEGETEEDAPDIDPDEKADISLDELDVDPDDVEEEAGAASADESDPDDQDDTDEQGTDETASQPAMHDGETWGDQYVSMLALLLGEIAESTDGEPGKTAEDIEELARAPPVELDENVDEWLQQAGMGADVPPGKAVAIGTAGLVAVVLLTETDAASDLMDGLSDQLTDADLL